MEKMNGSMIVKRVIFVLGVLMSLFHVVTAGIGALPAMEQRSVHLGFTLILILLPTILSAGSKMWEKVVSVVLSVCVFVISIYTYLNWQTMTLRVATPTQIDMVFGAIMLVTLLYATKKKLGWPLPIICIVMLLYGLLGQYMPGPLRHRGYDLARIIPQMYMSTEGIYGSVLGISATYIFLFILFGAMMEYSGAAKFFIDLSSSLVGRKKGGVAKVAIVASGLFGMVSGSATANVVAIGPVTTPGMIKTGYSNRFSGAVVAVGGTGGQFMPPIMGAAAFIIAETLGIPYISVAKAAFIPAVLYYAMLWIAVDIRTTRENVGVLPEEDIPNFKKVISEGFYMAFPFLLLIFCMVALQWSPIRAGFFALVATVVTSWFKKATRMGLDKIAEAFYKGAMDAVPVAVVCSAAGILIGMLSLTGLGMKFSSLLIALSMGNRIVLLALTAIAGLILGMGMPATPVYIILAVLVTPSLIEMGIPTLAAHLFVYYFGILSAITPPVAMASFAAASLVKDDPFKLGFTAWRLGLAGYVLPFMFIYNKELLFEGNVLLVLKCAITASIGIYALAVSLEGFMKKKVPVVMRVALFAASLLLIDSGFLTDAIGLVIVGFALWQYGSLKRLESATSE